LLGAGEIGMYISPIGRELVRNAAFLTDLRT
jgi:hypothetical protein